VLDLEESGNIIMLKFMVSELDKEHLKLTFLFVAPKGAIYVVDSADEKSLDATAEVLADVVHEARFDGKPILM
jgi:hypothetical protein